MTRSIRGAKGPRLRTTNSPIGNEEPMDAGDGATDPVEEAAAHEAMPDSDHRIEDGGDEGGQEGDGEGGSKREEHWVSGDKVVGKIKELIHEGNVRRIIIRNEEGRTLIEVPLTLGFGVAILIPVWAAIGAVAAVVTRCSIIVEREED